MWAHTLCRDVDGWAAGTTFLKQMRLLQDTLVPQVEHWSDAITVVRRPFKVGSMRTNGQRRVEMTTLSDTTPAWEFIVLSPPYLRRAWDYLPRLNRGHVRSRSGALEGGRDVGGSGWAGAELPGPGTVLEADRPWGWQRCPSCSEGLSFVGAFARSHKTVLLSCTATPYTLKAYVLRLRKVSRPKRGEF